MLLQAGRTVNGHVEELLGFDDAHECVNVLHDLEHHALLVDSANVVGVAVRAVVDDPVHVQVLPQARKRTKNVCLCKRYF